MFVIPLWRSIKRRREAVRVCLQFLRIVSSRCRILFQYRVRVKGFRRTTTMLEEQWRRRMHWIAVGIFELNRRHSVSHALTHAGVVMTARHAYYVSPSNTVSKVVNVANVVLPKGEGRCTVTRRIRSMIATSSDPAANILLFKHKYAAVKALFLTKKQQFFHRKTASFAEFTQYKRRLVEYEQQKRYQSLLQDTYTPLESRKARSFARSVRLHEPKRPTAPYMTLRPRQSDITRLFDTAQQLQQQNFEAVMAEAVWALEGLRDVTTPANVASVKEQRWRREEAAEQMGRTVVYDALGPGTCPFWGPPDPP